MVNSRQKGKRGELEAKNYLNRLLGVTDCCRGQQRSGLDIADVICPETVPGIHFEVKHLVKGFAVGTKHLSDAVAQAERDAGENQWAFVLWREQSKRQYRLSWLHPELNVPITIADDQAILHMIEKKKWGVADLLRPDHA